jgi:hypothetical protein
MQSKRKKKVSKDVAQSYLESIFILISIKFYSRVLTNAAIVMICAIAHATSQKMFATIRLRNAFLKNVTSSWEKKNINFANGICKETAKAMFVVAGKLGCPAYGKAQKQQCVC